MELKLRHLFVFLILLVWNGAASAQDYSKSANTWYFGDKAGLDFNFSPPQVITNSTFSSLEGIATISDENGDLLFYSDGHTVWDRSHTPMPAGDKSLSGHWSSSQSALITPNLFDKNKYYVFTLDELGRNEGFSYSIVDLSLEGNGNANLVLGDVVVQERNINLVNPVSEKVTAILKENQQEYWVVCQSWDTNEFYAFEVTCEGINETPVISAIGNIHTGGPSNINAVGYMKASPQGDKIAIVNRTNNSIDLFDFDKSTGEFSNEIIIESTDDILYGLEFTIDNEFLFFGSRSRMTRYALNSGETLNLGLDDLDFISAANNFKAIQRGPDGEIYLSVLNKPYLSMIDDPSGVNPSIVSKSIFLDPLMEGITTNYGLPNIFYHFDRCTTSMGSEVLYACEGFSVTYHGEEYFPGNTYEVSIPLENCCDSIVNLSVDFIEPYYSTLDFVNCSDTLFIFDGNQIEAGSSMAIVYAAENGCDSTVLVTVNERYFEELIFEVCEEELIPFGNVDYPIGTDTLFYFIDTNGCDSVLQLSVLQASTIQYNDVTTITKPACFNDDNGRIDLSNNIPLTEEYEFSLDGINYQSDPVFENLAAGDYQVFVKDKNDCFIEELVVVEEIPELFLSIPDLDLACNQDSLLIKVDVLNGNEDLLVWQWSTGSNTQSIFIDDVGTYAFQAQSQCQEFNESIAIEREVDDQIIQYYVPNAFSPNGDGINDCFQLFVNEEMTIQKFDLHIYDRWGNEVFNTDDPMDCWNGSFKGKRLQNSIFVYQLDLDLYSCKTNYTFQESGALNLTN